MEPEFRDTSGRRGKVIIAVGVILAVVAGGAAFYLVNQATQTAGQQQLQKVPVVVAAREVPARQAIVEEDVAVREVPLDDTNANGIVADPKLVIGRIPAVTIFAGQLVTQNLLASTQAGDTFSILGPGESLSPDSPAWRAVSITVPDDLAVGGILKAGQTVDVFVTAVVVVPQSVADTGKYMSDRSTKIVYQNVVILARKDQFYIVKAPIAMAEELAHLQAVGTATMSMVLRPDIDQRPVDASALGETTNRIIEKYGLPIPETYPAGTGPLATLPPIASPTPFPSPTPASSGSPDASAPASATP
jgi:Flp pilus assembly protein CpaB